MIFVILHVSDQYSSTDLTLLLKIRSLVRVLMFVDLQTGLRVIKAHNLRGSNHLSVPIPCTNAYDSKAIRYTALKLWQSLPFEIKEC